MSRPIVPISLSAASDQPGPIDTRLRGRQLRLAQIAWLVLALPSIGLYLASVPVYFAYLLTPCPAAACMNGQLTPDILGRLYALGLSADFYAAYTVALDVAVAAIYSAVAILLFWRKSDDPMALFAALTLLTFGSATFTSSMQLLAELYPVWWFPVQIVGFIGDVTMLTFLYLFPDGQFVPRWARWLAILWMAYQVPAYFFPHSPANLSGTWLGQVIFSGLIGSGLAAQVYRYRRIANRAQRQQTKWVVFGSAVGICLELIIAAILVNGILPWEVAPGSLSYFVSLTGAFLGLLLIPLSIGAAIMRYRLFDIDIIINRTLVYGALTVCVASLYVLIVGSLGALFQASGNLLIALLTTGFVAVLFQPLRARVQRGVNHLMYGERDEPYAVLARLGQRLETTLAADAVLPTIVETVAQALKLPYASIRCEQDGRWVTVQAVGTPMADPVHLPLIYQTETIGQLVLGLRAPGEPFSPADRRLLNDLARQIAVAVHAERLTAELQQLASDLQRSRERLVVTREEERRRLRRDLHDGLGPTLAALALSASAIPELIPANPAGAAALAQQLESDIRTTVGEIRRLIHGLRPPALDELGLAGAVRDRATQLMRQHGAALLHGLRVQVETSEPLLQLPAAVEVAAYRIVEEALTNVVRHAQARTCLVRLILADTLKVEIVDDGIGLPVERRTGVGLLSMRERAAELGGTCVVEGLDGSGTRVSARLPLPKE